MIFEQTAFWVGAGVGAIGTPLFVLVYNAILNATELQEQSTEQTTETIKEE